MFSDNVSHFSIKNDFIKQLDWKIPLEEIFADSKVEALHYGAIKATLLFFFFLLQLYISQ